MRIYTQVLRRVYVWRVCESLKRNIHTQNIMYKIFSYVLRLVYFGVRNARASALWNRFWGFFLFFSMRSSFRNSDDVADNTSAQYTKTHEKPKTRNCSTKKHVIRNWTRTNVELNYCKSAQNYYVVRTGPNKPNRL